MRGEENGKCEELFLYVAALVGLVFSIGASPVNREALAVEDETVDLVPERHYLVPYVNAARTLTKQPSRLETFHAT